MHAFLSRTTRVDWAEVAIVGLHEGMGDRNCKAIARARKK